MSKKVGKTGYRSDYQSYIGVHWACALVAVMVWVVIVRLLMFLLLLLLLIILVK